MPDVPVKKRRLTEADWQLIADFIADEHSGRARRRRGLEKQWKEVDRQLRMDPLPKVDDDGNPIQGMGWMSALELPNQSQSLELLTADARRMMFPTDRNFFSAHAALDDEELRGLEESTLIPGLDDSNKRALNAVSPGQKQQISQDDLNALVEGVLIHHHSMYDMRGAWDRMNAEAFKYGTHVGRLRRVRREKFTNEYRGVFPKNFRFPAIMPQSVWNTYLDDSFTATMQEGLMVAPSFIYSFWQILDDLRLAAQGDGWRPSALKGLEPLGESRSVQLLEFEGDLVVPRTKGPSMFLPNVLATVVVGQSGDKTVGRVVRYRELEFDFRTYLTSPYHVEDLRSPYGVGPLMKGAPIQTAATDALNKLMDSSALKNKPPMWWNPSDPHLQGMGGAEIFPGAQWPALTQPQPIDVGSDPAALLQVYLSLIQMYADVTGISAPRLGAQTKSHQTAFAIDTEQTRGVVRTVDYVRSINMGPMMSALSMEYEMIRQMPKQNVFIPKFRQFVEISGSQLPKQVIFEVHGAGGPAEEQELQQTRSLALQQALQVELTRRQVGEQGMDLEAVQRSLLEQGKWVDVEQFFVQSAPGGGSDVPGLAGIIQEEPAGALAGLQSTAA